MLVEAAVLLLARLTSARLTALQGEECGDELVECAARAGDCRGETGDNLLPLLEMLTRHTHYYSSTGPQ